VQWALAAVPAAVMVAFGYWVTIYVPTTRAHRGLTWHLSLVLAGALLIVGPTRAFFQEKRNDDISSKLRTIKSLNAYIKDNQNRLQTIIVKSKAHPAHSLSNQAYLLASDIRAELAKYPNPAWGSRQYFSYLNHNFANRIFNVTGPLRVVRPDDLFLRHGLLPKNEHDYFQIAANLERIADSL
jgi:hypothetical protein